MDRDETPVGGLSKPLQPTRQLFYVTIAMDLAAVLLSLLIGPWFCAAITAYILASRAYSFRGIRLKRFPILGYLTVILFQGGLTYWMVYFGSASQIALYSDSPYAFPLLPSKIPLAAACLLIGGFYPLTQIYQHDADRADGVLTISARLGYRGTFVFCGIMYTLAMGFLGYYFWTLNKMRDFFILATLLMPVALYFVTWAHKVWQDEKQANFNNTMRMNIVASLCTSIAFLFILTWRYFE
jgi:1,4-dihydroxy-2-naphthoate octaprenyltransferase